MKASSQYTYRRIIERYLARVDKPGVRYGTYPAKRATVGVLDAHIAELAKTPASANNLRKALKRLFDYAVKLGWLSTNPAALTDSFNTGPAITLGQMKRSHGSAHITLSVRFREPS